MKWLATCIMNRIVGDGSSIWSLAMQREFDELQGGHLGWALGCVGALGLTDVRQNPGFYIAILLSAYFMVIPYQELVGQLMMHNEKLFIDFFFALDHLGQIPLAMALGFWRPTRALTITLLGGYLGYTVGGLLYVINSFGGNFLELFWSNSSYQVIGKGGENAFLATCIDLAVWYVAALVGGRLRRVARDLRKQPA
jgi:hypothetical protein